MQSTQSISIPAPPEAVWVALTEPQHQSAWRRAEVVGALPGDGGTTGGTGALWWVRHRPHGGLQTEVVALAEPGERLLLHRTESLWFRDWVCEVTLVGNGRATQVRWTERRGTWWRLPGPMARRLQRRVAAELHALAEFVRTRPTLRAQTVGRSPTLARDDRDFEALLEAAAKCQREQATLADAFARDGDDKQFFARVYALLTARAIEWSRGRRAVHPGWALRLIPAFHELYMRNMVAWREGRWRDVEYPWQRALRAMDGRDGVREGAPARMMRGMLYAIEAHVDEDLPRALADVYLRHYADVCDFDRFRADFVLLRRMFTEANDDFVEAVPKRYTPLNLRIAKATMPTEVLEVLRNRVQYDVPTGRLAAFERGKRLAEQLRDVRGRGDLEATG